MLNPVRDKNEGKCLGGEGQGRHLRPRLVQKIGEGKTSYGLRTIANVMPKKKEKRCCRSIEEERLKLWVLPLCPSTHRNVRLDQK